MPVVAQTQQPPAVDTAALAALMRLQLRQDAAQPSALALDTTGRAEDSTSGPSRPASGTRVSLGPLGPDPNGSRAGADSTSSTRLDRARPTYRIRRTAAPIAGDGHVHAPAEIEVGYAPLRPNEVTTINVWPFLGTRLTFPYTVKDVAVFDDKTFKVQKYHNSVLINVVDCDQGCMARMDVFLDDGELTAVQYLLVVDQRNHTPTIARNYTDPVSDRIRTLADSLRIASMNQTRRDVATQLEPEVERCLMDGFTFNPVHLSSEYRDPATGETLRLTIADAGYSGACLPRPRLYLRYVIENARLQPASDIAFRVGWRKRHTSQVRPARVIIDQRTPQVIPALQRVRGVLVLDGSDRLQPGEELTVRVTIDGHDLEVAPVLSTPLTPGGHR